MNVVCLGGGPGGLYTAISLKLKNPEHQVAVYERNKPGDTFGWGVVFSDQTMDNLIANDPVSAQQMNAELIHWDYIDVIVNGRKDRSGGHGFIGIGRKRLLEILSARAQELGVEMHFESDIDVSHLQQQFPQADVIVAADGLNSRVRNGDLEHFEADIDIRTNKFVWLGTKQTFDDAFTFIWEKTEHGWLWVHAYQFDQNTSTFIVECDTQTYDNFGFDSMTHDESAETCRKVFEKSLDGHKLLTNSAHIRGSAWINFPRVLCHNWIKDNVVLIGDAAHTAHFSIGSGTKLALEDAISLATKIDASSDIQTGLREYQDEREIDALKLQSSARNSLTWFEQLDRYSKFDFEQFSYSLLTRSQRVSHENLRLRDQSWLEGMEKWFAEQALGHPVREPIPPMFVPFKLREMTLANRVVVSPMSMYCADNGVPDDWHLVHYGSLAKGGAGLIYTEMTDVSPDARITTGCTGLWNDEQQQRWTKIVGFVHQHSGAKMAIQLGHAGPKGATKKPWDSSISDEPLEAGAWDLVSASATPFAEHSKVPQQMTPDQMQAVLADFVSATERADKCGFDMLELHAAHGYLISAFITPVLNKREDEFGGSLENRMRYPLEVFSAMRAVWPAHKPMAVRISSNDWVGDLGITPDESVLIAKLFKQAGADIIDVSAGQTSLDAKPIYGRMFQTPFSDQIRNDADIPTMAVGNIFEVDHVNSILMAGRADLCCLARPHLSDANWTLRAAAEQGYCGDGVSVPQQYEAGFTQLQRNLQRAADMAINV
ncbi:MAG: anthraniloyl-CoA monooxygenase [Dinoroseobacter sp.]|jgi:anthraniloyl-CoA monooxygenase